MTGLKPRTSCEDTCLTGSTPGGRDGRATLSSGELGAGAQRTLTSRPHRGSQPALECTPLSALQTAPSAKTALAGPGISGNEGKEDLHTGGLMEVSLKSDSRKPTVLHSGAAIMETVVSPQEIKYGTAT